MMDNIVEIIVSFFLFFGLLFSLVGIIGMIRFKNLFQKIHAASLIETVGALMILIGLICLEGLSLVSFKLIFIAFLLLLMGPIATNVVAKVAIREEVLKKDKGANLLNS